jgi:Spy/CpxP family protein refolding chaperone
MASEQPICCDHRKEAQHARQLAADVSDQRIAEALLKYAEEQEQEWGEEMLQSPPLYSGPAVA